MPKRKAPGNAAQRDVVANFLYKRVLDEIIYPMLGKKTSWAHDILKIGMKLFGKNFSGVFPSDKIPDLGKNPDGSTVTNTNIQQGARLYSIVNLDDSNEPGSHWISLAYDIESKKVFVYDSFGRATAEIIPTVIAKFGRGNVVTVDDDAEQAIEEEDCGARSLAFLFVFDRLGSEYAVHI